jgi:hypothetical protein
MSPSFVLAKPPALDREGLVVALHHMHLAAAATVKARERAGVGQVRPAVFWNIPGHSQDVKANPPHEN